MSGCSVLSRTSTRSVTRSSRSSRAGPAIGESLRRRTPVTALGHPFDWHLHIFWTLAVPALSSWLSDGDPAPRTAGPLATPVVPFHAGVVALLVAFMWPLGDLAAHWSLLALVLQRLLLMLAVPPLLVTGTPRPIIVRLTRPARRRCRPARHRQAGAGRAHRHRRGRGHADHGRRRPGGPLGRRPRA